jgi:predicted DNA-binding ribbon-helix-helix protein
VNSPVIKRSIVVDGRKTSISVEDIFWISLKEIAADGGTTLAGLVASIDADRAHGSNLSSAIRVFILRHFQTLTRVLSRADEIASLHAPEMG